MIAALVLAAGESRRLGQPKLLLPLGPSSVIERVVDACLGSAAERVIVVLGAEADRVRARLGPRPVTFAFNPDFREGMSASIRQGLAAAGPEAEAVLVVLGDQPLLTAPLIDRLITAYRRTGRGLVFPVVRGTRGHPVLIDGRYREAMLALRGDVGCRAILEAHPEDGWPVPVDDEAPLTDVDTRDDYERVRGGLEPPARGVRMGAGLDRASVLIRGAGEMATGVAHRLARAGVRVLLTEIAAPTAIRRSVAFAEAVYDGEKEVEGLTAVRVTTPAEVEAAWARGQVPVIVDPEALIRTATRPTVVVDATMRKANTGTVRGHAPLVVGLGPGFAAGRDVDLVVETNRGHHLGRVIAAGSAEADTGLPAPVDGITTARVLRAPSAGFLFGARRIGEVVPAGDIVAWVGGQPVRAEVAGVLRGLVRDGTRVADGTKVGDIDPRARPEYCYTISDKARAIAGGVLEAVVGFLARRSRGEE
jgi:xanthine dehydrogenase accessory factor